MKFNMTKLALLVVIAQWEDSDTKGISLYELCEQVNLSKGTTVYRYIDDFEKKGLIKIKDRKQRGGDTHILQITEKGKSLNLPSLDELEKLFKISNKIETI